MEEIDLLNSILKELVNINNFLQILFYSFILLLIIYFRLLVF